MRLKILRRNSPIINYEYCYIIFNPSDNMDVAEIYDNSIQIDNFEDFSYWLEQQIYYLTRDQFRKIDGVWLRMMIDCYKKRDELLF